MGNRKMNGSGHVKQLPSGSWLGQVMDGYRQDGKKNMVYFTAPTESEAQAKIRDYWLEKRAGAHFCEDENLTPFSEWADIWYEDYKSQVQTSTYCNYQYTLKILKSYFKTKPIERIKAMDVNRFHDYLRNASLSKSYITKCRAMLIQIFDAAEANELIHSNPARKAKSIRILPTLEDEDVGNKDAFTDEEQKQLKTYLPEDLTGHTILLMLGTGVRAQEILALQPGDISEDGSNITINKAIKTVNGMPTLGPTKSRKSKRTIPVPEDFRKNALYLKHHAGEQYVWTSQRENGLYDLGTFRRRYYRVMKEIPSVRALSPHCCRHTYISNLEKRGVPMEQIARLAGHSRIATTDGYVHTDLVTLSNAVSVLNEAEGQ